MGVFFYFKYQEIVKIAERTQQLQGVGFECSSNWTKGFKPNQPNIMNFQRVGLRTRCQSKPRSLYIVGCGRTNEEMGSSLKCCPRVFRLRSLMFSSCTFNTRFSWFFKTMQIAAVFSFFSLPSLFPPSLILGEFFTLYTSFQSILTFHLLIVHVITRVFVPSVAFLSPL